MQRVVRFPTYVHMQMHIFIRTDVIVEDKRTNIRQSGKLNKLCKAKDLQHKQELKFYIHTNIDFIYFNIQI